MGGIAGSIAKRSANTGVTLGGTTHRIWDGALRSAWTALVRKMLASKRSASALVWMCRSRLSVKSKVQSLLREGLEFSAPGDATKECVGIDVVVPQVGVCQESETSGVSWRVEYFQENSEEAPPKVK